MSFTEKFLVAQNTTRDTVTDTASKTARGISQKMSEYDEHEKSHKEILRDLNAGQWTVYSADGTCMLCPRGDYHFLLDVREESFGDRLVCRGEAREGFLPVDDQRAAEVRMMRDHLSARSA